ncbi:hypothetical protein BC830DRAFT_46757 [Chytriomyces sp. MP71]|nr:hypothetical protein BC830DRAFT_46757 [Chytriomyces sp. MP71]
MTALESKQRATGFFRGLFGMRASAVLSATSTPLRAPPPTPSSLSLSSLSPNEDAVANAAVGADSAPDVVAGTFPGSASRLVSDTRDAAEPHTTVPVAPGDYVHSTFASDNSSSTLGPQQSVQESPTADIAASLFSSDFWASTPLSNSAHEIAGDDPSVHVDAALVKTFTLPSSQLASTVRRKKTASILSVADLHQPPKSVRPTSLGDASKPQRVSVQKSSVELAKAWHRSAKEEGLSLEPFAASDMMKAASVIENPSMPVLSSQRRKSSKRAASASIKLQQPNAVKLTSDSSSEEEDDSVHSSSEDERPLSQLSRPHILNDENAPLSHVGNQLRFSSLNRSMSPTLLSTRMQSPPPPVSSAFISFPGVGYTHSESSNSETTLVAPSPKSTQAPQRDFKSFMSTIFSNKRSSVEPELRSLGFSLSPNRSQSPTPTGSVETPPMVPFGRGNMSLHRSASAGGPSYPPTNINQSFNPQLLARRNNSYDGVLNRMGPQQPPFSPASPPPPPFLSPHMMPGPQIGSMHNPAFLNAYYAGRNWSGSDGYGGGGSDYGANPRVWSGSESGAPPRSDYGGSQYSAVSSHRPALAPHQPLVNIPGVTNVSPMLPTAPPPAASPLSTMSSPQPALMQFSMVPLPPPGMPPSPPGDPNQLFHYMMFYREMANKAYEAYQLQTMSSGGSINGDGVPVQLHGAGLQVNSSASAGPVMPSQLSINTSINATTSTSPMKSPTSSPLATKNRATKSKQSTSSLSTKKTSSKKKPVVVEGSVSESEDTSGSGSEFVQAREYLSTPSPGPQLGLNRRSATAHPVLQRVASQSSLASAQSTTSGKPIGILRTASNGSAVGRVKKGVKFDETAAAGDHERGPMTKRKKGKSQLPKA